MRFHFSERELLYSHLSTRAEFEGFYAIPIGIGGSSDALLMRATERGDRQSVLIAQLRRRGSYLRLRDSVYYRVPNGEISELSLETLRHLRLQGLEAAVAILQQRFIREMVSSDDWAIDERLELEDMWRAYGWTPMDRSDEMLSWNRLSSVLSGFSGLTPPAESLVATAKTWQLPEVIWREEHVVDAFEREFTSKMWQSLLLCCGKNSLIAMDRHHPCFRFVPSRCRGLASRNYWAIPFLPLENDYFFVDENLAFGYFGFYAEKRVTVFGENLIASVDQFLPDMIR